MEPLVASGVRSPLLEWAVDLQAARSGPGWRSGGPWPSCCAHRRAGGRTPPAPGVQRGAAGGPWRPFSPGGAGRRSPGCAPAGRGGSLAAPGRPAALIGAPVAVSFPLQKGSVGPLVGPWCPFSPVGAGRRSPGRAQWAGVALWPLLAVLLR